MKKVSINGPSDLKIPTVKKIYAYIINFLGNKHLFRVVATTPNYQGFEILFGLVRYERGEKYEFHIYGSEKFAELVMAALKENGWNIVKFQKK